jgi:hypothetical protein
MARVLLQREVARRFTGGQLEFDIEAANYRALVTALDIRFPGLAAALSIRTAVAIDGQIYSDPLLEPIEPDSEVQFLPVIGGG